MERNISELAVDIQGIISKLPGVISSKVSHEMDELSEIHILADLKRHPKQISRDVVSSIQAAYHVEVDRKIISIAQICDEHDIADVPRIHFKYVNYYVHTNNLVDIEVCLSYNGQDFKSNKSGMNVRRNLEKLIAESTIACVEEILGTEHMFVFEDVDFTVIAKEDACIVAVSIIEGREAALNVGAAVVKNDQREAVVRATLDAVNRMVLRFKS